jgi:hypothetical protein
MSVNTVDDRLAGQWQFNPIHASADFSIRYLVASSRSPSA